MNSGPESCTGIGVVAWLFVIWCIRTWLREKHERRWSESPNMAIIQRVTEMDLISTDTSSRPVQVTRSKSAAISNEIAFSIGESALGKILVARSAVGVCAILIGSDAAELSSDLATRFPDSRLV